MLFSLAILSLSFYFSPPLLSISLALPLSIYLFSYLAILFLFTSLFLSALQNVGSDTDYAQRLSYKLHM